MTGHPPTTPAAAAQSLASGAAGAALLALELGEDARPWLTEMVAEPIMAHPDEATLFEGAPAVAFTLTATRHHRALATLDAHVETITQTRLGAAHHRIDRGDLPAKREFDLISGLTGLGAYLLHRHDGGDLLNEVLAYLVRLTEPHPDGLPGWWATDSPTGPTSPGSNDGWHGGHGNLGIAHGIAGPLALLALAMRRGVNIAGQTEAMCRICWWLDQWRCGSGHRVWWPGAITRAEQVNGHLNRTVNKTMRQHNPPRPSWCYGTPGLARAQQLAGLALNDAQRQRFAEQVMTWCFSDPQQYTQLCDVSICHGWAGTLHTAWRAGEHNEQVHAALPRLLEGLNDCLMHRPPHRRGQPSGLLNGDPGARLALHATTTNTPPRTRWDACLLLN